MALSSESLEGLARVLAGLSANELHTILSRLAGGNSSRASRIELAYRILQHADWATSAPAMFAGLLQEAELQALCAAHNLPPLGDKGSLAQRIVDFALEHSAPADLPHPTGANPRKALASARMPLAEISPSKIGRYFFHDCERFLRFSTANAERRRLEPVERKHEHSTVMQAVLDSGYDWERQVLGRLGAAALLADGTLPVHERQHSHSETVALLRIARPGQWLYQTTLRAPASFYAATGLDPAVAAFRDCHPDLLQVTSTGNGRRQVRVVDIKRGAELRTVYRVQVLLYADLLAHLVQAHGISDLDVDVERGAAWLGQGSVPEVFEFASVRPFVDGLLRADLERVVAADIADVHWHVQFRCEWCEYFDHCVGEMRNCDDISRVKGMTSNGKRFLQQREGVRTVAALHEWLEGPEASRRLTECGTLRGRYHDLRQQTRALVEGVPVATQGSSPIMPKTESVRIVLTLQREPLGGKVYLLGMYISGFRDKLAELGMNRPDPKVWVAATPEVVGQTQQEFLETLHAVLRSVDQLNRTKEWKDRLSVQLYVHSHQDLALLQGLLLERLTDKNTQRKAVELLMVLQGAGLIEAEQSPNAVVAPPVTVLLDALGQMLAIPVDVSWTLPETLAALKSWLTYKRSDAIHFPLGHGLRAESIHRAWCQNDARAVAEVERHGKQLLRAIDALVGSVRDHANGGLFAWADRFALPDYASLKDPTWSRLAFLMQYESLLQCTEVRRRRAAPRAVQMEHGHATRVVVRQDGWLDIAGPIGDDVEPGGYGFWLLVPDSEAGRLAQLSYPDWQRRTRPYLQNEHEDRSVVTLAEGISDDGGSWRRILVAPVGGKALANKLTVGSAALLLPAFADQTLERRLTFLRHFDAANRLAVPQLLMAPQSSVQIRSLTARQTASAQDVAQRLKLTPSQQGALEHVIANSVTVVWGPPGTGKTRFLATAFLALAEAQRSAGKPFRVLVSAFTHAAIENVLRKVMELTEELAKPTAVGKVRELRRASPGIQIVQEKGAGMLAWFQAHDISVVGATVNACAKLLDHGALTPPFDLVILDEASQIKVSDAAIPMALASDSGRLVLAGDDLQLPPIVHGSYPEPQAQSPALYGSIMDALVHWARNEPLVKVQLVETWRLNDVLAGHAQQLYGPQFQSASAIVARQRLVWQAPKGTSDLLQWLLDPEWPLVAVVLHGVHAGAENRVEAELVAELMVALRNGMSRPGHGSRTAAVDDAWFWKEGAFVVSPHHVQIDLIRHALGARRKWAEDGRPFVDTVDKMQGQEAEAVVVSYGVADAELAAAEAEFIYSLNRLNVAVTRAKCKAVVCLPQPLLDGTIAVLDDEGAGRGLAYMRGLVEYVRTTGETRRFELGDGVWVSAGRTNHRPAARS